MFIADDVQSHVPGQRYFGVDYDQKTTTDFEDDAASAAAAAPAAAAAATNVVRFFVNI